MPGFAAGGFRGFLARTVFYLEVDNFQAFGPKVFQLDWDCKPRLAGIYGRVGVKTLEAGYWFF